MDQYLMGINIGSQSIRVYLYDLKMRKVAGVSRLQQPIRTEKPVWATQKAAFWWDTVCELTAEAVANAGIAAEQVAAIGCCAHMHGAVPVCADGSTGMEDIQMYSDKRGAYLADRLRADKNFEQTYRLTANPPTSHWFGIKIKWIKENMPEVYQRAVCFLTPKDYINYQLTGETCIDPSEASGSYMMDKDTDQWSGLLVENLGLDLEKLPRIAQAAEVIGAVTERAAQQTGLAPGTKVVCCGGDMLCTLYVSGLNQKGNLVDSTATGSSLCYYDDRPVMDLRVMNLRHVLPGWVPFGEVDSSGGALRWLRDTLAKKEADAARAQGVDEYDYLSRLAQKTPPGADGLLFFPYLLGERTMGSADSRGCFIGLNLKTDLGYMVRALMEGVAFEHKKSLMIFESKGGAVDYIYAVSGGAKGDLWNQIKADIYERPVYTLENEDGESLGAAMLAGVGAGFFPDAGKAADSVLKIKKKYMPNRENANVYRKLYEVYCSLHDMLQQPFHQLADAVRKSNGSGGSEK